MCYKYIAKNISFIWIFLAELVPMSHIPQEQVFLTSGARLQRVGFELCVPFPKSWDFGPWLLSSSVYKYMSFGSFERYSAQTFLPSSFIFSFFSIYYFRFSSLFFLKFFANFDIFEKLEKFLMSSWIYTS